MALTLEMVERPASDVSEREAEYGFVLPRVRGRTLDVGFVDGQLMDHFPKAIGADPRASGRYGEREVEADLVAGLPFVDGAFDTVVCLSTLEHLGMGFYGDPHYGDRPLAAAFRELARVSRGTVLVTVPLRCPIPDFHHDIAVGELMEWAEGVADLTHLTLFWWAEPCGPSRVRHVAAAEYRV